MDKQVTAEVETAWEKYLEAMLVYLDKLRASGAVNMYGAGSFLEIDFGLNKDTARQVLHHWMETFYGRHLEEREN